MNVEVWRLAGGPTLLARLVVPVARVSADRLRGWLSARSARVGTCLYWREPVGDAFAGFDTCWERELDDAGRLSDFELAASLGIEEAVGGKDAGGLRDGTRQLPLFWVGHSFTGLTPRRDTAWRDWPAAWMWIPRRLAFTRGKRSGVVGHALVSSRSELPAVGARLVRDLATLADELERFVPSPAPAAEEVAGPRVNGSDPEAFQRLVAGARARIRSGHEQKLVVARQIAYALPAGKRFDPWRTLCRLAAEDPDTFLFAFRPGGGRGCFVGASPELLVRVRGRQVETHALAGTDARGGGHLLDSRKDACEHQLTLEAIRLALREVCSELEVSATPRVKRLARVEHLETPVRGWLRERTGVLELVRRLHPTPAVGGWPQREALEWLAQCEGLERGYYAGPLGWVGADGDGSFTVAIRSGLLRGREAWTYAGAGVVADSDPQAEWEETELKLQTMERALSAVAEAGEAGIGQAGIEQGT